MSLLIFSIQNAFRKKAVAALAIFGVAFGTALMTLILSISAGMANRVEQTISDLSNRIVVSGRDAIFGGLFFGMGTSPIPSTYIDIVKSVPHVEKVYSQVAVIMRPVNVKYSMPLFGYGAEDVATVTNKIIEGNSPQNDYEIIIGNSLQEYMKFLNFPYEIGGVYPFIIPDKGQVKMLELKVVGVYQTGNEILDGSFSGSEKLAREIGMIPVGKVSSINVMVDGVNNMEATARAIQNEMAEQKPEVQVVVPTEVLNPVKNVLDTFGKFLIVVSVVSVVAGGLSIMVVMLLSVVNRMREFGILKAMGWTPINIIFLVLMESLLLSMFGAALGVTLGYGGLVLVRALLALDTAVITWQVIASVCLAGVIIGVAGGIYPAWRANSVVPAIILREAG